MRETSRVRKRGVARDVIPSPNIWNWPDVYELENRAQDVDGSLWRATAAAADWAGADVVDVGCGDGHHLPRMAAEARSVVGVEPVLALVERARERVRDVGGVSVLRGSAAELPLPDAGVDVVHARTAYFFGPGCEAGLFEAQRVLRPGGRIVIVDLDATHEPYGGWMRATSPKYRPAVAERFFADRGFECTRVDTRWRFERREDLEAVLRIEFNPTVAARAISDTPGLEIPVRYRVHVRRSALLAPG